MKQKAIRTSPWTPPDLWSGDMAAITIGGLFMLSLGTWAFFGSASFADFVAFPYNRHLLHDVGAFQIVAINDLMPMESLALLFKRDTVHGIWPEDVELDANILRIGDREIKK
jgi:hypothetical protein